MNIEELRKSWDDERKAIDDAFNKLMNEQIKKALRNE